MKSAYVWVGNFDSENAMMDYCDHSKAKCPWRDQFPLGKKRGTGSYIQAFKQPKESLRDAIVQLSYSPGYDEPVLETLREQGEIERVNSIKVVYFSTENTDTIDPSSWPTDTMLRFLGRFDYDDQTPYSHPERRTEPAYEQEGWVSIWIGTAESEEFIEAYMQEGEYDEDEGRPPSKFGHDWKLSYDHDYLFHEGYPEPKPVAELLDGWRAAESFAQPAVAAATGAGITEGNFMVVAYDLDYSQKPPFSTLDDAGYWRHKGKPSAKSPLKFVGAFRYT